MSFPSTHICASASSITTRIKTKSTYRFRGFFSVRVHLPLQQGLRHHLLNCDLFFFLVRVHLPLQQGLRHKLSNHCGYLRLLVRVHLPLQQGLRLHLVLVELHPLETSASASSITTRIKTPRSAPYTPLVR